MKTLLFSEYLADNPNLYNNLGLDEATIENLNSWFQFRYICDNTKFEAFYRRLIKMLLNQYNKQLELETSNIDWFVMNYSENLKIDSSTGIRSIITNSNGTNAVTQNTTSTRTPTLEHSDVYTEANTNTGTQNIARSTTGKTDSTGNETTSTEGTNSSDSKRLGSQLPNSITYSSGGTTFPDLSWEVATEQEETKGTGSSTSTGTTNSTNITNSEGAENSTTTNDLTNNISSTRTISEGGNDKTVTEYSDNSNNSQKTDTSEKNEQNSNYKETSSGRSGVLSSEILEKAKTCILELNAFRWLVEQLEVCFICIYD